MSIKPSVYTLGTKPPELKTDQGAGQWKTAPKEASMYALKVLLTGKVVGGIPGDVLASAFAPLMAIRLVGLSIQTGASYLGGDDAVKHMLHYLGNSGDRYTIDFQGMINEVPLAKQVQDVQIDAAKKFVETLPPGQHNFTSTTGSLNHYIHQGLSRNWFFAVGSYTTWGRGTATVKQTGGQMSYTMNYELNFFDRYNWDGGKQVFIPIPGYNSYPAAIQSLINLLPNVTGGQLRVTDEFMAKFHRQGLAQEFNMDATLRQTVTWGGKAPFITHKVQPGETLSLLAKRYYGDLHQWPRIHEANKADVPNPNLIRIGQELKIPQ